MLDKSSPTARDFIVFKRQLYQMYEVQNRSVNEHELFSFKIDRENIKWLYKANVDFIAEMRRVEALDQLADFSSLSKGQVLKRKTLNPRRFKGLGAFASLAGIYSYLPYLTVYVGSTIPVFAMCAAGLYGMLAFAES